MTYKVTEKHPLTGGFIVRNIVREGPTVLLTTSTRTLGHQLMTRMFVLEIPDDPGSIRDVLAVQAQIEVEGLVPTPDESLIAFQEYLQAMAPWDVVVPFAPALATEIGKQTTLQPRLFRDYSRLLAFIKSVTVL